MEDAQSMVKQTASHDAVCSDVDTELLLQILIFSLLLPPECEDNGNGTFDGGSKPECTSHASLTLVHLTTNHATKEQGDD